LLTISFSSLILVVVAMVIGLKIKNKIPQENYNKVIKGFLFLMAIALIYQTIF
jgi:type III secretion system FlhB-like substrate exporter